MNDETEKSQRRMTRTELFNCGILFQQHLKPIEGTPYYQYEEGWSDRRVAREIGDEALHVSVGNYRREIPFNFPPRPTRAAAAPAEPDSALVQALEEIRAELGQIKSRLAAIQDIGSTLRKDLEREINLREKGDAANHTRLETLERRIGALEDSERRRGGQLSLGTPLGGTMTSPGNVSNIGG